MSANPRPIFRDEALNEAAVAALKVCDGAWKVFDRRSRTNGDDVEQDDMSDRQHRGFPQS